jgi:subtilisin family serine protease
MNRSTFAFFFGMAELVLFSFVVRGESRATSWIEARGVKQAFKVDFSRRAVESTTMGRGRSVTRGVTFTGGDEDFQMMGVGLEDRRGEGDDFGRGLPVRFASGGIGLLTNAVLIGVDTLEGLGHALMGSTFVERLMPSADVYRVVYASPEAALEAVSILQSHKTIRFVHPDFRLPIEGRGNQDPTQEPLWPLAWHLKTLQVRDAWGVTTGSSSALVALIDLGFEADHPDLASAWAVNSDEIPNNRKDDDGNGLVDDVMGWNFGVRSPNLLYGAGPGHGTATAGIIAARANGLGVSGICPSCRVLPLVIDDQVSSAVSAFLYAKARGATIVSNSWGYRVGTPETEALTEAIQRIALDGREGKGTSVVFAMGNKDRDDCRGPEPDISALPFVIAVSSVDASDRKIFDAGYGGCLSVLAPSSVGRSQGIVTTDRRGAKGFNTGSERGDLPNLDYTNSFHGTSAAAPQVAGALALLYSVCPTLGAKEAYDLLIGSTDKVRPEEAHYDPLNGRSTTYGYGRLNVATLVDHAQTHLSSARCSVPKNEKNSTNEA